MNIYRNIANRELPTLLRACYDVNDGNLERAAHDLETFDILLGVTRMRSIINARSRKKETRWSRGRNYQGIIEKVITRRETNDEIQ